jgi:hypothetical protein
MGTRIAVSIVIGEKQTLRKQFNQKEKETPATYACDLKSFMMSRN